MYKQIKMFSVLSLLMLVGAANAQKANRYEFSVQQAVAFAQKNNVQVKNALLAIQAQMQTNKEITASALPTISGSIGTNHFPNVAVQTLPNFISPATFYRDWETE